MLTLNLTCVGAGLSDLKPSILKSFMVTDLKSVGSGVDSSNSSLNTSLL